MLNNMVVLLIIANQGYQQIEYGYTRKALEEAGIKVEVASNLKQDAHANPKTQLSQNQTRACGCNKALAQYETAHVNYSLDEVDPNKYDGIFIIGGSGTLESLDNAKTYKIIQAIANTGKAFGAICIAPRILAKAGVLNGKKATGWDADNKLSDFFKEHNVIYEKQPIVIDGSLITANGPLAAPAFGKVIVSILQKKT